MKHLLSVLAAALILGACSDRPEPVRVAQPPASDSPAPVETGPKTYSAADFYNTTSFSVPSADGNTFSPDSSKVLISSDETGVFNVYSVDISTGERTALTNSTSNGNFGVSYFPADERVLFRADGGGDELTHVWVRELDGSIRDLTASDNTKASFGGWSADGGHFYVLSNERDPKAFDLYLYSAETYEREMIYQNDMALAIDGVSRDGRWISMTRPKNNADSDVFLVETSFNAEPKLITEHTGNIAYSSFTFTPDSSQLILATNEHGEWNQAWAYNIEDGATTQHLAADWDVLFIDYSSTGKYEYSGINADASTVVSVRESSTGSQIQMPDLPAGNMQNVRFSADDSLMAFMLNGDTVPSDIFVYDIAGGSVKRLTHALNPAIDPKDLAEATVVRYESFDGTLIPSILYKPKQASPSNKVPALVFVHGGPGGQTRRGYSAIMQHLVNHGYAILGANNRGSSGYGKTFNHMDDRRHGEEDLQDIVWGRKYLESLNWVDGDKVGIIGGSYGGFMVAAALAFEPDAFNVGVDIFGVTNWVRTLKAIPPWWEAMRASLYDEMGDPATDEERHRSISPLFHAANITKPLLVVQGANDPRVLQVESDELVAAVRANNVPVEYLIFPDEGHGFVNRNNRISASDTFVSFLDTYLKGNRPKGMQ